MTLKIKKLENKEPVYDINVEDNHNFFANGILVHNCGEQGLPPDGSCLLGSINLTKFVEDPFKRAKFNWQEFEEVIAVFTRMLDNVVEINGLPLKEQRNEITQKRRHGMGFMGLGSALNMMGIKYGSPESLRFTSRIAKTIALIGFKVGHELALEKGPAPIMEQLFDGAPLKEEYEARGGDAYSEKMKGKELWAHSYYMLKIKKLDPELWAALRKDGCRFTHHSSVAPTGTIALSLGNNCSNGIEPSFAHHYTRNLIKPGKNTKENVDVWSYESLKYREIFGSDVELPSDWDTTDTLSPKDHIDIQAAAQQWVDSSISKCVDAESTMVILNGKVVYLDEIEINPEEDTFTTIDYSTHDHRGDAVDVISIYNNGLRDCIKVTFDDGSSITVTPNHRIYTENGWCKAVDLNLGENI